MLAERTTLIKGSQTSGMRNRARRLAEQGVAVVNFAAGELDLDTSATIKRETKGGRGRAAKSVHGHHGDRRIKHFLEEVA
jgi:hypothetical protein